MFRAQFISVHTPSKMNTNPDNLSFLFQRINSVESQRSFVFFCDSVNYAPLLFNVSPLLPAVSSQSCEKCVTVETFVSVAGWMWTVTGADVLIMMCILVFLCIQTLTLEKNFLNASFSLAYAYLKIKIFIVHFKLNCAVSFLTQYKSFFFTGNATCKCLFSHKRSYNMPLPPSRDHHWPERRLLSGFLWSTSPQ